MRRLINPHLIDTVAPLGGTLNAVHPDIATGCRGMNLNFSQIFSAFRRTPDSLKMLAIAGCLDFVRCRTGTLPVNLHTYNVEYAAKIHLKV